MALIQFHPESIMPRLLVVSVIIVPLSFALFNFYLLMNLGIDDNLFVSSPSRLYINKSIVGQPKHAQGLVIEDPYASIEMGDLLIAINGKRVYSLLEAYRQQEHADYIDMTVLRTSGSLRNLLTYRVLSKYISSDWLIEIPSAVIVEQVTQGGASDRAGVKKGDLIYRINGSGFANDKVADYLVRSTLAGQKVDYEIIRKGKIITLQVTMARVKIQFILLGIQLYCFFWICFGMFLAFMRPCLPAARYVGLGIFLVGISFSLLNGPGAIPKEVFLTLRDLAIWPSLLFGFAFFFVGFFYFPKERPELIAKPWLRRIYYFFALFAVIHYFFSRNITHVLAWLGVMILCHFIIRFRYWRNETREYKKLEMPLRWSGILTFLLILFRVFFYKTNNNYLESLLDCINIGLPFSAVVYTIVRYRLLGLMISRNLQFSILRICLIFLWIVVFFQVVIYLAHNPVAVPNLRFTGYSLEISADPLPELERIALERIAVMLNCALFGVFLLRSGSFLLSKMQRKFHRMPYDLNQVSQELIELMSSRQSKIELARGIVTRLARLMFLKQVGILFFRENHVVVKEEAFRRENARWIDECATQLETLMATVKRYKCEVCIDYFDPAIKDSLVRDGYKYVYPIYSKEELVGCLLVGEKLSEATYRMDDFTFLAATARQAGVAIENAFLHDRIAEQDRFRHELDIARRIQLSSLPQSDPLIPGFDVSGGSVPALEVGGDYYGYFQDGEACFTVIVGDVSGKGTSAALHMSKLQGILGSVCCESLRPKELFIRVNPILYQFLDRQSFVTAICLRFYFDSNEALLARAGHLPLFHYQAALGKVIYHQPKGMGLALENRGLLANILEEQRIPFNIGDIFVMPSDGITEAQNEAMESFGEQRLAKEIEGLAAKTAAQIKESLFRRVHDFTGDIPQHDDETLVVIKIC